MIIFGQAQLKMNIPVEMLILQKDSLIGGIIQTSNSYYVIFPIDNHAAFFNGA